MKQGTTQHRKFLRLKRTLSLRTWQCVGLLESLWHFTAQNAEDGQLVPRCTPDDIALFLEWEDADTSRVIDALVDSGWIDRAPNGDLSIHDWHDHMPDYLRERLRKRQERGVSRECPGQLPTVALTKPSQAQPIQAKNRAAPSSAAADCPPGFARFWAAWPSNERKTGKAKCVGLWRRLKLEPKADAVVAAVEAWKQTESWTKEHGRFVPMPQTWLNGGRWEDAPGTASSGTSDTSAWYHALPSDQKQALLDKYRIACRTMSKKDQDRPGAFMRWAETQRAQAGSGDK